MAANVSYTVNNQDSINMLENIYSYATKLIIKNETEAIAGNTQDSEFKFAVLDKLINANNTATSGTSSYKIECNENNPIIKIPIQLLVKKINENDYEFIDPQYSVLLERPSNLFNSDGQKQWETNNISTEFLNFVKGKYSSDSYICYHDSNAYYGELQVKKSINPYFARKAPDYGILGYFKQATELSKITDATVVNWVKLPFTATYNDENITKTVILYFNVFKPQSEESAISLHDYKFWYSLYSDDNTYSIEKSISVKTIDVDTYAEFKISFKEGENSERTYRIVKGAKNSTLEIYDVTDILETEEVTDAEPKLIYTLNLANKIDSANSSDSNINFIWGLNLVPYVDVVYEDDNIETVRFNTWTIIGDIFSGDNKKKKICELEFDAKYNRLKIIKFTSSYGQQALADDNKVEIQYSENIKSYGNNIVYSFSDNETTQFEGKNYSCVSVSVELASVNYDTTINDRSEVTKYNKSVSYISSDFNEAKATRFREIYEDCLNYFNGVLYSYAFAGEENYRAFVGLYILNAALQKYIAGETADLSNIEILDDSTIKNYLRSYGLSAIVDTGIFMNKLEYLRLLLNNINDLITTRGSKASVDLIKNMFKAAALTIKRYIAVKTSEGIHVIALDYDEGRNINYVIRNSGYTEYDKFIEETGDATGSFLSAKELEDIDFNYVATKYLSFSISADIKNNSDALSYLSSLFINDANRYGLNKLKLSSQIVLDGLVIPTDTLLSDLIKGMFQIYLFYNSGDTNIPASGNYNDLYVTEDKLIYVEKEGDYYVVPSTTGIAKVNGLSVASSTLGDVSNLLGYQTDSVLDGNGNRHYVLNNKIAKVRLSSSSLAGPIELVRNNRIVRITEDGTTSDIQDIDVSGSEMVFYKKVDVSPNSNINARYVTVQNGNKYRIFILDNNLLGHDNLYAVSGEKLDLIYGHGSLPTTASLDSRTDVTYTKTENGIMVKVGSNPQPIYDVKLLNTDTLLNTNTYYFEYLKHIYTITIASNSDSGTADIQYSEKYIEMQNNYFEVLRIQNLLNSTKFCTKTGGEENLAVDKVFINVNFRDGALENNHHIFIDNNRYLGLNTKAMYDSTADNESELKYNEAELKNIIGDINLSPKVLDSDLTSYTSDSISSSIFEGIKDEYLLFKIVRSGDTDDPADILTRLKRITNLSFYKGSTLYSVDGYVPLCYENANRSSLYIYLKIKNLNDSTVLDPNGSFDLLGTFRETEGVLSRLELTLKTLSGYYSTNALPTRSLSISYNKKFLANCIQILSEYREETSWPKGDGGNSLSLYQIYQLDMVDQLNAVALNEINNMCVNLLGDEFKFADITNITEVPAEDIQRFASNFKDTISLMVYHLRLRANLYDSKNEEKIAPSKDYSLNFPNPFSSVLDVLLYKIDLPHILIDGEPEETYYENSQRILNLLKVLFIFATTYTEEATTDDIIKNVRLYVQQDLINGINTLDSRVKSIIGTVLNVYSPTALSGSPSLSNDWRTKAIFAIRNYLEEMLYSYKCDAETSNEAKRFFYRYYTRAVDYLNVSTIDGKYSIPNNLLKASSGFQENLDSYLYMRREDKKSALSMCEAILQTLIEVYTTLDSEVFVDIKSSSMIDATETIVFIKLLINYFKSYTAYLKSSEILPEINSDRERVYLKDSVHISTDYTVLDSVNDTYGISSFQFGEKIEGLPKQNTSQGQ